MRRNLCVCLCFSLALLCLPAPMDGRLAHGQAPQRAGNLSQHLTQWFQQLRGRIQTIQQQLKKTPKARRFPLLMKLAKEYESVIRVHGLLVKKYETYRGSSLWSRLQPLQREANRQAILFRIKAAQLYQMLLSEYPTNPGLCDAYYGLARHLYRLKKPKLSYTIYKALIDAYQGRRCAYKAQAYLALGEQQLRLGKTKAAIKRFRQSVAEGHTSARAFALFKIGRAHYKLMAYTKAMADYVKALRYLQTAPTAGKPRDPQPLHRQLRQQLVLASSHVARPSSAIELFQKVAPLHAQSMGHLLAGVYKTQGKFAYASALQLRFAKQANSGAEALDHLRKALALKRKVSPDKVVRQQAQALQSLIQKHMSQRDGSAFRKAALKLHVALVRYGMAQQKRRKFQAAIAWYKLSGKLLKPSQGSEMLFWQGEAYMALRKYYHAAKSYRRYTQTLPTGRLAKVAAYNRVLAHDRGLQAAGHKGPRPWKPGGVRTDSPSIHITGMYHASEDFLRKHGADPRAPAVRYRYMHYTHRFDNIPLTLKLFWQMAKAHPKHPYTSQAAALVVSLLRRHKAWKAQAKWSARLLQQKTLSKNTRSQLQRLHFAARLQLCAQAASHNTKGTKAPTPRPLPVARPTSQASRRPASRRPASRPTSRPMAARKPSPHATSQPAAQSKEQLRRQVRCLRALARDLKATPALAKRAQQRAAAVEKQLKKR